VNVEVPADHTEVVEDSKAGDTANQAERAVDRLENKLRGSVFNHNFSPLDFINFLT
jgi:hypothetical protein